MSRSEVRGQRSELLVLAALLLSCAGCTREPARGDVKGAIATAATTANELNDNQQPNGRGALAAAALANILQPPAEAGAHRFAVEGCAATPEVEPPATRSLPPPDKVEASALEGGVLLTHEVAHACCLSAATAVTLEGTKVVVTETLSGSPCRCRCSSSLRTAVGLEPGTWQVEVKTVSPGKTWVAWTGELKVTDTLKR
jgi:hypothetical protein